MYRGDHQGRISAAEILDYKRHSNLSDKQRDHKDYIADVVTMCSKLHGCYGLFYDITVSLIQNIKLHRYTVTRHCKESMNKLTGPYYYNNNHCHHRAGYREEETDGSDP